MLIKIRIFAVGLALAICGLATAQEGDDLETTFDGLVRIDKRIYTLSWTDPDTHLTVHNKVICGEAHFQFRVVKKTSSLAARRSNAREFWISDRDNESLEETVTGIPSEEIAKSKEFEVASEPGSDTLIICGGLFDFVSRVPPKPNRPGRDLSVIRW